MDTNGIQVTLDMWNLIAVIAIPIITNAIVALWQYVAFKVRMVEEVKNLKEDVLDIRNDVAAFRKESKSDMESLRTEVQREQSTMWGRMDALAEQINNELRSRLVRAESKLETLQGSNASKGDEK